MIATQTAALFVDAYRELNARKLFWITLALSAIVVIAFAFVSITDEGLVLFGMDFRHPVLNARFIKPSEFYRVLFVGLAIPYWLAWPAVILALISTAGIIPDFVSGGSIEGFLSKPIGRTRLFLTKVIGALLFVTAQVALFTFGWFLLIGIRAGEWTPSVFLAIPFVVVFYSYLYAICALVGLLTRSTIAALLVTLLVWLGLWAGNWTDIYLLGQREGNALRVEDLTNDLDRAEAAGNLQRTADLREELEEAEADYRGSKRWFAAISIIRTVLPKTSETTNLLERYVVSFENEDELEQASRNENRQQAEEIPSWLLMADPRVAERIAERRQERSIFWIIGSSLAFEVVVLGAACLIFSRRDF